jgi:hypothetical protein
LLIGCVLLTCIAPSSSGWGAVLAAPPAQGEPFSETFGHPDDLYLTYTISGVDNVEHLGSRLYSGQYAGGAVHFSGVMIAVVGEGMVSWVRMGASLTGGHDVKYPEGSETHAEVRGNRIELPFDFTLPSPPDDGTSTINATAVVEKCGGICARHMVVFSIDLPTPAAPPTPTTTPTPEPTTPPQKRVTVQGKVYASALSGWVPTRSSGWQPTYPLTELAVTLTQGGEVVARTLSQAPDGFYELTAPAAEGLVLRVELIHGITSPPAFQVVYDRETDPVAVATDPFDIADDAPDFLERDLVFSPDSDLHSLGAASQDHLADLGAIYYFARQAWEEGAIHLGLTMDLSPPLDVRAFDSDPETVVAGSVCYVPLSSSPGFPESVVALSPDDSRLAKNLERSVVWHEFGHCLMTDIQGNVYPDNPGDTNHGGYANPSTTDSWGEGFATFYALLVQRDIEKAPRPLLSMSRWTHNFEFPTYMPWTYISGTSMEEYAVTSLLWDLVDDVENITQLEASQQRLLDAGISLTPTLHAEAPVRLYGDFVQVSAAELARIISRDVSAIDPPAAAAGYPYVFDVRQLYAVLVDEGIGAEPSPYPGLTRLDELFIAHGFFADTSPQNLYYDSGEAIGYAAHMTRTIDKLHFPARPLRRYPPPVPDAFLHYQAIDAKSGAPVEVDEFEVTVSYEPPYDAHSYTFHTRSREPDRLSLLAPDPAIPVSIHIRVSSPDYESEPLVIAGQDYWESLRNTSSGTFMSHIFEVTPVSFATGQVDLPDVPPLTLLVLGLVCGGAVLIGAVVVLALVLRARKRRVVAHPASMPHAGARCPACGAGVGPGARFCANCGTTLGGFPPGPPQGSRPPPAPPQQARRSPAPPRQARQRPAPPQQSGLPPAPPWQSARPPAAYPHSAPVGYGVAPSPAHEPVVGVVSRIERRKGLVAQAFNLVLTPQRLVFARLTSQMLRDAAEQARQAARAQGVGFMGQWGAVTQANAAICARYYHTPVEVILREHPDNFSIPAGQVQRVQIIQGDVDEDQVTHGRMVIHAPGKMTFTLRGGDAAQARQALRQVLGGRVR